MLIDRLVERRYCMRDERCPSFNWKEHALESWIILVLQITFRLQTDVMFSVYCDELCTHVGKLIVMYFKILKSDKLVLLF